MAQAKPKKNGIVGKKLVGMADVVIAAAQRAKDPTFEIPIRALSNVSFNPRRGLIEMGTRSSPVRSSTSAWQKFMQTMLVADALAELQQADLTTSLREIYYRTKHTIQDSHENTFDTQDESDPIIEDLEVSLVALREELHVRAENSGSIVGPVVFGDDGDRVDCAKNGQGWLFRTLHRRAGVSRNPSLHGRFSSLGGKGPSGTGCRKTSSGGATIACC